MRRLDTGQHHCGRPVLVALFAVVVAWSVHSEVESADAPPEAKTAPADALDAVSPTVIRSEASRPLVTSRTRNRRHRSFARLLAIKLTHREKTRPGEPSPKPLRPLGRSIIHGLTTATTADQERRVESSVRLHLIRQTPVGSRMPLPRPTGSRDRGQNRLPSGSLRLRKLKRITSTMCSPRLSKLPRRT